MPQIIDFNIFAPLDRVQFLVGSNDLIRKLVDVPALQPFDESVLSFLADLSKELIGVREYSDVVTLGFWLRKASLNTLKERFNASDTGYKGHKGHKEGFKLGRGLVFHIAPSNVPVNFAYSLVSALLMGNNNIVRVPSKDFPQVKIITEAINTVLHDHPAMKARIACVRYSSQGAEVKAINDLFSSLCDVRVIWGGDRTIETLRQSPLQARSSEITFADRYSLAVIDADEYLAIQDKERVAQDFYNDTFFSDQNACTSPRVIVWVGTKEKITEAKQLFWQLEHDLVKQKYNFQAIMAVNKLTRAYLDAAREQPSLKIEHSEDNLIIRVTVSDPSVLIDRDDGLSNNSGFFYEVDSERAQITKTLDAICNDKRCQTVSYIGNKEMFKELIDSGIRGIDRIVPIGKTMDFDLIWDGYDLPKYLSRIISTPLATAPLSIPLAKTHTIVTSLVDFLNALHDQGTSGLTVYRGHADETYEIKPSLFRSKELKERENELLKEIEAARPDDFPSSMTTLEKLVLLQHYQLPTRLLDVTLNPLVALYFAVCSHPDKNAEVLAFSVDDTSIAKSFDSDTVSCFANLAELSASDKAHIEKLLQEKEDNLARQKKAYETITAETLCSCISKYYDEILELLSKNQMPDIDEELNFALNLVYCYDYQSKRPFEERMQEILNLDKSILGKTIEEVKTQFCYGYIQNTRRSFNSDPAVQRLIHSIRSEKSFFQANINPDDFRKVVYVKAKQSNPRIVAQDGAFFIFGINENIDDKNIPKRIKIDAHSKEKIKQELDIIGFNEHKLFPELEYFAKDLKEKYKA